MNYTITKQINILALLLLVVSPASLLLAQANFSDISATSGFNNTGINRGIAIGDFDNDGDDDVYISRQGETNFLYQNNGDGTYTDVAESHGVNYGGTTHTSVWGDFDNDGFIDLYLGNYDEANILYHNNGDGSFTDISVNAGVDIVGKPRSVLMADVDMDGYLDIYVANFNEENALFKNNSDGTFTNETMQSGTSDTQKNMGAIFFDYDNDGDPDLYLTHDGNQAYILYQNDGTGNFTDVSAAAGVDYAGQGMGTDFGDFNNDGWLDIYITNLNINTLYQNNGDGTFTNISASAMITDPGMGWGTTFIDYDNDGLQDIYMVNDSYFSPLPNIMYRNNGDNTFTNVSENTPLGSMSGSYGTACTDINQDGLVDIFVSNNGADGNQLFLNETVDAGNYFRLKAIGTISNRSAIGTKVTIEAGGKVFTDEVAGGSGYASQNSLTLHFGIGTADMVDLMTIRWPNGLEETYENLEINQLMIATENESLNVNTTNPENFDFAISTFPNPVSSELTIKIDNEEAQYFEITVSDLMGRNSTEIFSGQITQGKEAIQWQPNLNSGVYLLIFRSEQYVLTKKIVIN